MNVLLNNNWGEKTIYFHKFSIYSAGPKERLAIFSLTCKKKPRKVLSDLARVICQLGPGTWLEGCRAGSA